jgi:hypothetical protein
MKREKTKHKGIYKMGEDYYITYYDSTTKISKKTGAPYLVKHGKPNAPEGSASIGHQRPAKTYQREDHC